MLKKEPVKKRGIKISILLAVTAVLIAAVFSINVSSFPGKFCTGSPCACGSNCSGGNELFGQSQSYCDSNPIECFNTIDDCRDGTIVSLNYVKDINVSSLNDSVFKAGDTISIDATLFSSSANSEGVFFVYSNSSVNSSVNWSVIYNTAFGIADSNYHIKFNFTIPNRPGQHTVRVIDEFSQTRNITCGRDSDAEFPAYSDTDDVVFTVNPEPAPSINFTGPTPSNQSTVDSLTITVNVTHSEAHPDTLILYWNGTNETYSYSGSSTSIQKPNLAPGNYTFYVWVNDTFGNVNQTETRIAAVSSLVDITVKSPQNGQQLAQNSIFFNFTAKPNQANRTITSAWYVLDSDPQVPVLNRINLSADSSDQNGVINESLAGRFNLSQSFTPLLAMEAINISLRLAKTGNPNVTMQIRTDSSNSPSSTIIAEASIPNNSVSSSGFGWVNLTLNQTAVLQNGTRYWIYMPNGTSNEFYSWEANDDGISGGQLYQNTSRDLLFQLFDLYTYYIQVSSLDDDSHSIRAYVNNSDNLTFSSSLISFLTDTETPAYSSITESSDPIEVGNNMTITVDISESVTSLSSVLLSFNSTNRTMSLESGETYTVTFNAGIFGSNTYYIFANDSVGNYFNTSILSFQATDSRAPDFSALSNNPSTEDSLDPGSLINVSATITDIGYVSSAVLLYKLSNSSSWSNTSMSNSSGLYYGNFTPGQSGNWTFRIWANDSSNNANYSQNSTVEVSYDYTWTRTPSSFAAVSGIKGLNATIGNLTINNTGDFLLSFDLTPSQSFAAFNRTFPINIGAGSYENIFINASTPLTEAEYTILFTIDAENSSASPDSLQTNSTLVSIASGPYLIVEIIQYNTSLNDGDFSDLVARITNVGNETAFNITSNWSVPSDWATIPDYLNFSISNITVNHFSYHNITAVLNSSVSSGSKTISVYAEASGGISNQASKTVVVITNSSEDSDSGGSGSSGGGGGSGGSGGGGGGSLVIVENANPDLSIEFSKNIKLIAGLNNTIEINITSKLPDWKISGLKPKVDGFLLSRTAIKPKSIGEILPNEKGRFLFTFDVPVYMRYQNITLTLTFSGIAAPSSNVSGIGKSIGPVEKSVSVNAVIIDATPEVAKSAMLEADSRIKNLNALGFNTEILSGIMEKALERFNSGDYLESKKLSDKVISLSDSAIKVNEFLKVYKSRIELGEFSEDHAKEAQNLLKLSLDAVARGDFEQAVSMAEKIRILEGIKSIEQESSFQKIIKDFLLENWIFLAVSLALISLGVVVAKRASSISEINKQVEYLGKQENSVFELLKKVQEEYFKKNMMSERVYNQAVGRYAKRMADIQMKRINLLSKKIRILKNTKGSEMLESEKVSINHLIVEVQSKYFTKKIITRETYERSLELYREREAEIDTYLESIRKKQGPQENLKPKMAKEPGKNAIAREQSPKQEVQSQVKSSNEKVTLRLQRKMLRNAISALRKPIKSLSDEKKEELKEAISEYRAIAKKHRVFLGFGFGPRAKKEYPNPDYDNVKAVMLRGMKEVYKHGK